MRNEYTYDSNLADSQFFDYENFDNVFNANNYTKLKAYFEENKISEKSLYFVLVEDLYDTIKIEILIKKLAFIAFSFIEAKDYILSLPSQVDNVFMKIGYLKQNKIYYNGQNFIIPEAEPLENEYYKVSDLVESIEKSLTT